MLGTEEGAKMDGIALMGIFHILQNADQETLGTILNFTDFIYSIFHNYIKQPSLQLVCLNILGTLFNSNDRNLLSIINKEYSVI
jgi:hypothetical protein